MKRSLLLVMLVSIAANTIARAQRDTTLGEVSVRTKRKISGDTRISEFAPGQKITTIDSATLQQYQLQSMAALLAQQVPVFVKSYGINALATLNFRGSSAAQSQVLWNGVPIQNAALGVADVSTLPVLFMNRVSVVYGGSAALLGSGNVGGALLLENDPPAFDSGGHGLSLVAGGGSFAQYAGGLKSYISGKRWYFAANVFAQSAANDFPYTNDTGAGVRMSNSRLKSAAVLMRGACKIAEGNVVGLSAWYQRYDRFIPPALFERYSDKHQVDGALRLLADWRRNTQNNEWYAKASLTSDEMNYSYNAVNLHWDYITYQYFHELGWRHKFGRYGQLLLFSPVQLAWITQPDSATAKQQNKAALAAAYDVKLFHRRLDLAINMRGEMINDIAILLPGADASFSLTGWLSLRANVQRTYRAPTLNELYYYPGGNKTLKPEQGWCQDVGYTVRLMVGRFSFYHDLSVYNRNINDWIIWLGGAIWTPHNIAQVHSRGVETANNVTWSSGNWKVHLGVNTGYVLATTVSSYLYNDGSVGRQIPYTPRYTGQLNAGFNYRSFSFNYNHTYTGYRFITTDESAYISPYSTGNIQLMCDMSVRKHALQLTAQCNNIWNTPYQVVNGRPMPGINWQAGLALTIL